MLENQTFKIEWAKVEMSKKKIIFCVLKKYL